MCVCVRFSLSERLCVRSTGCSNCVMCLVRREGWGVAGLYSMLHFFLSSIQPAMASLHNGVFVLIGSNIKNIIREYWE